MRDWRDEDERAADGYVGRVQARFAEWYTKLPEHARRSFNRVKRAFGLSYYETHECPVCSGAGTLETFYDRKEQKEKAA